jgi:hypothetical protein
MKQNRLFLISNCRRVLNAAFFVLGVSPASEFYVPTFRNTLFHLHGWYTTYEDGTMCSETSADEIQTPRIPQKKEYNKINYDFITRKTRSFRAF